MTVPGRSENTQKGWNRMMNKKETMPILLGLAAEWNRAELRREFERSTTKWSKSLKPRTLALESNRQPWIRPGEDSDCSQDIADSLITQHLALNRGSIASQVSPDLAQIVLGLTDVLAGRAKREPVHAS